MCICIYIYMYTVIHICMHRSRVYFFVILLFTWANSQELGAHAPDLRYVGTCRAPEFQDLANSGYEGRNERVHAAPGAHRLQARKRRGFWQGLLFGLFKGDIDMNLEVDVGIDRYFDCFTGAPKSVQVLFDCIEAVLVLTVIVLNN